jgi:hypothetical protein
MNGDGFVLCKPGKPDNSYAQHMNWRPPLVRNVRATVDPSEWQWLDQTRGTPHVRGYRCHRARQAAPAVLTHGFSAIQVSGFPVLADRCPEVGPLLSNPSRLGDVSNGEDLEIEERPELTRSVLQRHRIVGLDDRKSTLAIKPAHELKECLSRRG